MQNINNMELQNIRHLLVEEQVKANKAKFFSQQVSNQQLRDFLSQESQQAEQNIQRLNQFISGY